MLLSLPCSALFGLVGMAGVPEGRTAIEAPLVLGPTSTTERDDDEEEEDTAEKAGAGAGAAAGSSVGAGAGGGKGPGKGKGAAKGEGKDTSAGAGAAAGGPVSMSTRTLVALIADGRDVVGMATRKARTPEEEREVRRSMEVLQPLAHQVLDQLSASADSAGESL